LSTTYKILTNILLSRLYPHLEEFLEIINVDFEHNISSTDHIFCIRQILEKKMGIKRKSAKTDYDSVRMEVFYNILVQFGIPIKLTRPIKM
jgi:hypothetical protein